MKQLNLSIVRLVLLINVTGHIFQSSNYVTYALLYSTVQQTGQVDVNDLSESTSRRNKAKHPQNAF